MVESTRTEKSDQISKISFCRINENIENTNKLEIWNKTYENNNYGLAALVTPAGRLRRNFKHWKEVCSNDYIIDVIDQGYTLPFMNFSATTEIKNESSA
jgi:hypothetical protein